MYSPVDTCEKDGVTLIPKSRQMSGKNGCDDGGNQFTCNCIAPWVDSVDPQLAYGFGAYNIHDPDGTIESACYYNEFLAQDPNGKTMKVRKMILQNINTSQGIPKGCWDVNLAGGGVGGYNKGCSNQWGSDWGQRYGGVDSQEACCKLPEGLRSSCLFRFVMFGSNPGLASTPKRVRCPVGLIDRSGSQRQDDATVAPYSGKTDQTGYPAPDKYQRNRAVCQNIDPMGIVSSVCGGVAGGARLPKGSGMVRQDSPGASVPDESGSSPPMGYQSDSDGMAPGTSGLAGGAGAGETSPDQPGLPEGGLGAGVLPNAPGVQVPGEAMQPGGNGPPKVNQPQGSVSNGQGLDVGAGAPQPYTPGSSTPIANPSTPIGPLDGLAGHRRGVCAHGKHKHNHG
ncbi:Cellulase [Pseudozyma hubeiensis]|nr:Cellulase [Pseudozyma hubeiensis]